MKAGRLPKDDGVEAGIRVCPLRLGKHTCAAVFYADLVTDIHRP
jgi:hypothetical protein